MLFMERNCAEHRAGRSIEPSMLQHGVKLHVHKSIYSVDATIEHVVQ